MEKVRVTVRGKIYSDIYEIDDITSEFTIVCSDSKRRLKVYMEKEKLKKFASMLGIGSAVIIDGRAHHAPGGETSAIDCHHILKI